MNLRHGNWYPLMLFVGLLHEREKAYGPWIRSFAFWTVAKRDMSISGDGMQESNRTTFQFRASEHLARLFNCGSRS